MTAIKPVTKSSMNYDERNQIVQCDDKIIDNILHGFYKIIMYTSVSQDFCSISGIVI